MLKITVLSNPDHVVTSLAKNGWNLTGTVPVLTATHPAATTKPELRHHLHESGLLTSPHVRIEFCK